MAARGYKTRDGRRVPSVTTILSKFDSSEGLVHWAWKLGRQGEDYRAHRDAAAAAGTLCHALIEDHICGTETADSSGLSEHIVSEALVAYDAYLAWRQTTDLVPVRSEVSLVSEIAGYAGTFDAMADHQGRLILLDWKTSKQPYPKMVAQLGAYCGLWEEHNPTQPVAGARLVLFNREGRGFREYRYNREQIETGMKLFALLRMAYHTLAEIEKFYKVEAHEGATTEAA